MKQTPPQMIQVALVTLVPSMAYSLLLTTVGSLTASIVLVAFVGVVLTSAIAIHLDRRYGSRE